MYCRLLNVWGERGVDINGKQLTPQRYTDVISSKKCHRSPMHARKEVSLQVSFRIDMSKTKIMVSLLSASYIIVCNSPTNNK